MSLHRIYAFCSLTGYLFVEQGTLHGRNGYWFANPDSRKREFLTADDLEATIQSGRRAAIIASTAPSSASHVA